MHVARYVCNTRELTMYPCTIICIFITFIKLSHSDINVLFFTLEHAYVAIRLFIDMLVITSTSIIDGKSTL